VNGDWGAAIARGGQRPMALLDPGVGASCTVAEIGWVPRAAGCRIPLRLD
jgi:hypothetical protein